MAEEIISYNLYNIDEAANWFIKIAKHYDVFAFHGQMGAGKTIFIKAVCKATGCAESMGSPTFSLVNEYYSPVLIKKIYHADLFRLENIEEALNIGIEDYLNDAESINFIEWPEIIEGLLPSDSVHVYIEIVTDTERTLRIVRP